MEGLQVEGARAPVAQRKPSPSAGAASAGASGQRTSPSAGASGQRTSPSALSKTTAFRWHANESHDPRDHDDKYRTLTLHADGTFTDFNEHLWDLKSEWVTEGVNCIVYGGTYTLEHPQVQLRFSKVVSKVDDVVTGKESLAAEEPLKEPVLISGTLSGTSLTVKPYSGGAAEPQTLVAGKKHAIHGSSKYC